jgi:hypothetical protein
MIRGIRIFEIATAAILISTAAVAQAPPTTKPPVAPKAEQLDPNACAQSDTPSTTGKGAESDQDDAQGNLSDKLARSGGVICPPKNVDPEIKQQTPPGGAMPVIPPPGTPVGTSRHSRSNRHQVVQ